MDADWTKLSVPQLKIYVFMFLNFLTFCAMYFFPGTRFLFLLFSLLLYFFTGTKFLFPGVDQEQN